MIYSENDFFSFEKKNYFYRNRTQLSVMETIKNINNSKFKIWSLTLST